MVQMWKQLFQINEKKTSQVQKLLQNLNDFSRSFECGKKIKSHTSDQVEFLNQELELLSYILTKLAVF